MPKPLLRSAALLFSLLLAAWYLHFRATGNSWISTRAAEGASDSLAAGSPTAPAPATKPTTILPSSKSGLVFQSRPVQFSDQTPEFAATPTIQPQPSSIDTLRLHNDAIPMTQQDVMMSSSKSIVVFDSKDAAAQAAKAKILNTAPAAAAASATPAAAPADRTTLLSSSKSGPVFPPSSGAKAATQPASAPAAPSKK